MSYGVFLIIFVCLPLLGLWRLLRGKIKRRHVLLLVGVSIMALLYTTPWDNYLVAKRVWYYDAKLVLNIIFGYVPFEEYAFFILQTFLTGFFALWLWHRFYPRTFESPDKHDDEVNN